MKTAGTETEEEITEVEMEQPVHEPVPPRRKPRSKTSVTIKNTKSRTDDKLDPDLNADRFKNRRRMAWVAMSLLTFSMCVIFFWVPASDVDKYEFFIMTLYAILSGIVLTYMGTSSYQYNSFLKYNSNKSTPKEEPEQE